MKIVKIKIHYFPPYLEFFTFLKNCLPAFKNLRISNKHYVTEISSLLYDRPDLL